MSINEEWIEQYLWKKSRSVGFVLIKKPKLDKIKDQTRAKLLLRQFKLTALGLNEPLHSLAFLVRRQQAHWEKGGGGRGEVEVRRLGEMKSGKWVWRGEKRRGRGGGERGARQSEAGRVGGDGRSEEMWKEGGGGEGMTKGDSCDANPIHPLARIHSHTGKALPINVNYLFTFVLLLDFCIFFPRPRNRPVLLYIVLPRQGQLQWTHLKNRLSTMPLEADKRSRASRGIRAGVNAI